MSGVPVSSRGGFNGGTITNPLTIDLSADVADRTALDVIQPSTFGFTLRPFRFRQTDFAYLQMETEGAVSVGGNDFWTAGGSIATRGGQLAIDTVLNVKQQVLAADGIGFFGVAQVVQQALNPSTATPEQIATVLATYGLTS